MEELIRLIEYCKDKKLWVSFNYSPFGETYQVYVNPGRTMSAAKRHKSLDDAVRACWVALGVNRGLDYSKAKTIQVPLKIEEFDKIATSAAEYIVKRRGRPKGSKNKPKVEA